MKKILYELKNNFGAYLCSRRGQVKISVIIWDEKRANRRAVVNGTLVAEGATVEGLKVVQINPTRIKFSKNGRTFEASIN